LEEQLKNILKKVIIAKLGEHIDVNVDDLSKQSHTKIDIKCDMCDKKMNQSYYAYNKNIKQQGFYACNDCKQIKIEKTKYRKIWL